MSLKEFKIINKLGQGAYSSVYKVERIQDSTQYALKKVKLNNLSEKQQQNALNQVRILASIHHQNIIGYKQAFIENNNLCIVMEFANDGDLYQKIVEYKKNAIFFQEKQIWIMLINITKALNTLHQFNILHRDLKSANVFLTKQGVAKLGDMNVSKIAKNGLLYTQTGTPYYASPQVWKDQPYDCKSDIWSLGCVIYEMATLKPPFRAEDMEGLYKKVIKGVYTKISNNYSIELNNIIKNLLQVNPNLRPSADKILTSSIVKKKMEQYQIKNEKQEENHLLKTIKFSKNFHYLTDRLPKANYSSIKAKSLDKVAFHDKYREDSNNQFYHLLPKIQTNANHEMALQKKRRRKKKNKDGLQIQGHSKIIQQVKHIQISKKNSRLESEINIQIKKIYENKNQKKSEYKLSSRNVSLPPIQS